MRIILTYIAECDHRSGGQVVRIVQENGGDTFPLVTPNANYEGDVWREAYKAKTHWVSAPTILFSRLSLLGLENQNYLTRFASY